MRFCPQPNQSENKLTAPDNAIVTVEAEPVLGFNEPTVPDLRLAEALGYERLTDIRKLIKRNLLALEAIGLVRHHGASIISGKGRITTVTEYHLSRAQTAFIIGKAKTKRADSMAVLMAEVYAMFSEGRLAVVDQAAADELQAAKDRERERRRLIHEEEKKARHTALKLMNRGRGRRKVAQRFPNGHPKA